MGDEIGDVLALGQVAGIGRGGVEDRRSSPASTFGTMPAATLPIAVSGTASTTASAPCKRRLERHAVGAGRLLQPLPRPASLTST